MVTPMVDRKKQGVSRIPPLTWTIRHTTSDGRRSLVAYTYLYKFTIYEWPHRIDVTISDAYGHVVDRGTLFNTTNDAKAAAYRWLKNAAGEGDE